LYYFFFPETPDECLWLKGRDLDVVDMAGRQVEIAESTPSAVGGRNVGCSAFSGS